MQKNKTVVISTTIRLSSLSMNLVYTRFLFKNTRCNDVTGDPRLVLALDCPTSAGLQVQNSNHNVGLHAQISVS